MDRPGARRGKEGVERVIWRRVRPGKVLMGAPRQLEEEAVSEGLPSPCPGPYLGEDEDGRLPLPLLLALQAGQQLSGHCLDLLAVFLHHGPGARGGGQGQGPACRCVPGSTSPYQRPSRGCMWAGTRRCECAMPLCTPGRPLASGLGWACGRQRSGPLGTSSRYGASGRCPYPRAPGRCACDQEQGTAFHARGRVHACEFLGCAHGGGGPGGHRGRYPQIPGQVVAWVRPCPLPWPHSYLARRPTPCG